MPNIKRFAGINNVLDPRRAGDNELQVCKNMFVDDGGSLVRRDGTTILWDDAACHSLFIYDDTILFVSGTTLYGWVGGVATALATGLTETMRMDYVAVSGKIYCSNGFESYVVSGGVALEWGCDPPSVPTFAVGTSGTIRNGSYGIAVTFLMSDGSESGASPIYDLVLESGETSFTVSVSDTRTDDGVVGACVYVTRRNADAQDAGQGMRLYSVIPKRDDGTFADLDVTSEVDGSEKSCQTLNMNRVPHGKHLCFYRGRVYSASGNVCWYSRPWAYGLCELDRSFFTFPHDIVGLLPVENGIWVNTEGGSVFVSGKSPNTEGGYEARIWSSVPASAGGVVVDSHKLQMRSIAPGKAALWVGEDGIYCGDSAGQITHLTRDTWKPSLGIGDGTGFLISVDGSLQYAFSTGGYMYWMNVSNKAVTYHTLTVSDMAQSDSTTYVAGTIGFGTLSGNEDGGEIPVSFEISKSGYGYGDNHLKRFTEMYLTGRCDGTLLVTSTAENASGAVAVSGSGPTGKVTKVDMPRKVQGATLGFSISATDGAYAELLGIETLVDVSAGRRGRRGHG